MEKELKDIDFDMLPLGTRIEFENGEIYYKISNELDDCLYFHGKYVDMNKEFEDWQIEKETGFCSHVDSYIKSIEKPTSYGIIYESNREKNIKSEIEQLKQKLKELEDKVNE